MDYFDALLRAAGLDAAANAAPAAGPLADAADLVEVDQEVVQAASLGDIADGDDSSPRVAADAASGELGTEPMGEPAALHRTATVANGAQPALAAAIDRAPSPQRHVPRAPDTAVHPLVQAALQWVAGDPQARAERTAVDTAESGARSTPDSAPRPAMRTTTASRQQRTVDANEAAAEPRRGERPTLPETSAAPAPRSAEAAPRPRSAAEPAPAAQRLAPEVHIGAIHVTVDAAPAPAVPPPSAPVAQPLPPAVRSDFLRSRAPRL